MVRSVRYIDGDALDAATIEITMREGATTAEVTTVLCDIAVPARDAGDPSEGLGMVVLNSAQRTVGHSSDSDACP
jgi:hypothetical protein